MMIPTGKADRIRGRKREPWAALLKKPQPAVNPEAMGTQLYKPAYATGLWRLNHEGLIPEGVTALTFATPRDEKTVTTKIGPIVYRRIPQHAFFGYTKKRGAMVATPEKALLDFLWLQNVEWDRKEFERWRIQDDWKRLNWPRLRQYLRRWEEPRLDRAVEALAVFLK